MCSSHDPMHLHAERGVQLEAGEGAALEADGGHARGPAVVVAHLLVAGQLLHRPPQLVRGHQTLPSV